MKVKLETNKMDLEQALACIESDENLTAKLIFKIKNETTLNEDVLDLKVRIPKNLKEIFKNYEDLLNRITFVFKIEQIRVSTKNVDRSGRKRLISCDKPLVIKLKNGKLETTKNNQGYLTLKQSEKLEKNLNYKNLKKFLTFVSREREFLGDYQY